MPGLLRTLGWAGYLACSWTWCIGMFLPALLMRDFGWAGFAVFAIPNVIGAAALGYYAPAGDRLAAWCDAHGPALRWFSRITIAFHLYFFGMLAWTLLAPPAFTIPVATAALVVMLAALRLGRGRVAAVSLAVFALSLAIAAAMLLAPEPPSPARHAALVAAAAPAQALGMLPACLLGFLACPVFDLTFLHARAATGDRSRVAFTLGFGLLFAAMIAFTAWYAPHLPFVGPGARLTTPHRWLLALHLVLQAAFTIAAHADRLLEPRPARPAGPIRIPPFALAPFALALVAGLLMGIGALARLLPPLGAMTAAEVGYRTFMVAYGLVFPAYLWLVVMPHGWKPIAPHRAALRRFAVVVAAAAPCYALGFLGGPAWWIIPGAAIVLAGRLLPTQRRTINA